VTNAFVAFDGNGNVTALVNAGDGTVVGNYEYGPFGEVIRNSGPLARNVPFRFSTKYQDDESDLLYYGFRYYKASTGTWPNRDPLLEWSHQLVERTREEAARQDRIAAPSHAGFKPFRGGRGRFYVGSDGGQAIFKIPTKPNTDFLEYQFCRNDSMNRFDIDGRADVPGCGYWIMQGGIGLAVAAADWVIKQKKCMELAEHPDEEMFGPSAGAAVLTIANMAAIIAYCPNGGRVYMHIWFDGKCNCKSDYVVICNRCSGGA
jgi:RHS repeat-associated protein